MPKSKSGMPLFKPFSDDKQLTALVATVCGCKSPDELRRHVDMWALVIACKTPGRFDGIVRTAEEIFKWLNRGWLYRDAIATNTLREYGIFCLAIGFMQGMATGKRLYTKTEGNVALLLKHAPVRRLLLKKPVATNLDICAVLDKYQRLPWTKLNRQYGTWTKAVGQQSVRTLITHARRAAKAAANYENLRVRSQDGQ